jgi:hypothetical protein
MLMSITLLFSIFVNLFFLVLGIEPRASYSTTYLTHYLLSYSAQAVITKYYRLLSGLTNRNLFFFTSGGWEGSRSRHQVGRFCFEASFLVM